MHETLIIGSPSPGLAEPLTLLQLTPMVLHLDLVHLETHMLRQVGIHMGRETHMRQLVEPHITHQLIQHLLHISLKHLHLGRHSKQALHLAEDLSTAAIHMLHYSEIRVTTSSGSTIHVQSQLLSMF